MSGHSKWANIKHRKAKMDAQKGNLFSKLGREIMVAARLGGSNPDTNFRLKVAVQKAREANMPMENIQRAIWRGTGEVEGANYETIIYEGYGPGGVAVLLEAMTDNRNRTASDIRYLFSKHGGSLGEAGCVSWLFDKKGLLVIDKGEAGVEEEQLFLMAIDAGAEDFKSEGDTYEITTSPEELEPVHEALRQKGIPISTAEITMIPQTTVRLAGEEAARILKLLDALQAHDDVQEVYANFDIPLAEMERFS